MAAARGLIGCRGSEGVLIEEVGRLGSARIGWIVGVAREWVGSVEIGVVLRGLDVR